MARNNGKWFLYGSMLIIALVVLFISGEAYAQASSWASCASTYSNGFNDCSSLNDIMYQLIKCQMTMSGATSEVYKLLADWQLVVASMMYGSCCNQVLLTLSMVSFKISVQFLCCSQKDLLHLGNIRQYQR